MSDLAALYSALDSAASTMGDHRGHARTGRRRMNTKDRDDALNWALDSVDWPTADGVRSQLLTRGYDVLPVPAEACPRVVVLCGSTRFKDAINAANARLTMRGQLVISLGVFGHADMPDQDWTTGGTKTKRMLDDLHKRKIDMADEVHVINVGGYIGESTRSEIDYALAVGKPITYLEPVKDASR